MKIGSNRVINRDHKKLTPPDVPNTVIPETQHDPASGRRPYHLNLRMLTENHNDENLAITSMVVGDGLIAYHFW